MDSRFPNFSKLLAKKELWHTHVSFESDPQLFHPTNGYVLGHTQLTCRIGCLFWKDPRWIFPWIGTSLHGQLWIFSRRLLHRRIGSWFGIPRWMCCVVSLNPTQTGVGGVRLWNMGGFMKNHSWTCLPSSFGSCSWTMVHLFWEPISWTSYGSSLQWAR